HGAGRGSGDPVDSGVPVVVTLVVFVVSFFVVSFFVVFLYVVFLFVVAVFFVVDGVLDRLVGLVLELLVEVVVLLLKAVVGVVDASRAGGLSPAEIRLLEHRPVTHGRQPSSASASAGAAFAAAAF